MTGQLQRVGTLSQWFTTSVFALPVLGTSGNAGHNLVRAPGINNWDVSFIKKTQVRESMALQLRAEFFNLFNHTQFGGVRRSLGATTFGQITSARNPRVSPFALKLLFQYPA